MKNLVEVLGRFCASHLLDEKIFIGPSYQIGHQIGEALAASGQAWINLHFVTLTSLAMETAGAELAQKGLKQSSPTATRVLINSIFRDLREEGELAYYGELEAQSGIISALYKAIQDLRGVGIKSDDLRVDQFIDEDKGRETQLILKRYEEALEKGKFYDSALLFTLAKECSKRQSDRIYLCLEHQVFSRVENEFLNSLTDNIIFVPCGQVEGLERPERLRKGAKGKKTASRTKTNLERAPWLFALKEAPPPFKDDSLQMFQALGPTNECREVLRRIIKDNIPFDQVEVIHPGGPTYPSIFYGLSEKMGFPFSTLEGLSIAFTIPGVVYSGIVDWMENDYPAKDFCALLESESLKTPKGDNGKALPSLQVSRVLKAAKIGWGFKRYEQRLNTLKEEIKKRAGQGQETDYLKSVTKVATWMKSIMDSFPTWEENEIIDMGELCRGLSSFLKANCRIKDDRDSEALGIITSRLDEVSSLAAILLTKDEVVEWLKSAVGSLCVGASGPLPGSVLLSSFGSGGYSGRLHTFIVGLEQGSVPGSRLPDPILLDEERGAISGDLIKTADRLRENLYLMTALLSSLGGKATLSYSSYDVIEQRPSFPSSFLLQVFRLLKGDAELDYTDLGAFLGRSSGFIPSESVEMDESDWWLLQLAGEERFKDALESIKTLYPHIAQGDYAKSKREGPDLSPYDGLVSLEKEVFHPCYDPEIAMSASRFETMAECPYRYFLGYVLDIEPPDEIILDKAQWLDGRQRGTLIHDILCAFMRQLREREEIVVADKHTGEIRDIAQKIIAVFREENPPPSEVIFEREKKEIFTALDIFMKAEEKRSYPVNPILFEANFGYMGEEGEGISEGFRFKLEDDQVFQLRGRIDRIDGLGSRHFRVIDYKTGSYVPYEEIEFFGKGKCLQHALYAEAAEFILKKLKIELSPRVSLSGYAFPTRKGDGREIVRENFDREELRALLKELLSFLETGFFLVNPEKNCGFCDYPEICGRHVIERTKKKKESNPGPFSVFDRLKEFK